MPSSASAPSSSSCAEGAPHEQRAARVVGEHAAADQGRECGDDRVEPALGQHDPLESLVRGDRTAQDRVLLVDEPAEGRLGDGDERHVVRHLDERQVTLSRSCHDRVRNRSVREAGAESEPRELMVGEQVDERALALRRVELKPRGEQQLAAGHPGRRVLQLGDVDPADRRLHASLARQQAQVEAAQQLVDRQHVLAPVLMLSADPRDACRP